MYFDLQEPLTVELGTSYKYQRSGSKRRLVEYKDTFQYIPLMDNLVQLLKNPEIFDEVCCTIASHAWPYMYIGDAISQTDRWLDR